MYFFLSLLSLSTHTVCYPQSPLGGAENPPPLPFVDQRQMSHIKGWSFHTKLEVNSESSSSWKHTSQIYLLLILARMTNITGNIFESCSCTCKSRYFPYSFSFTSLQNSMEYSVLKMRTLHLRETWRLTWGHMPINDGAEMLLRSVSSESNAFL